MDKIVLHGLVFRACHGCLPKERWQPQPFIVNITMELDLSRAIESDSLEHTVDYAEAYRVVEDIMVGPHHMLLESLAGRIGRALLESFETIQRIEIEIRKPEAPVPAQFEYFSVIVGISR